MGTRTLRQRFGPARASRSPHFLSAIGLLLAILPLRGQPSAPQVGGLNVQQTVDGLMRPFLSEQQVPGAIVAVSVHGQRSFYVYGSATDDGSPFAPTTLVEIGSCTKAFTTTLFALAINRHQITPDSSIGNYMPHGYTLQPLAQQVTPRELALFTSGLPDDPPNLPRQLEMRSIDHYSTKDFLRWIAGWSPDSAPPAPYLYSNAGTGLLGYLVVEATHVPWEQQVDQEITQPLGMGDTEVRPGPAQMRRMAQGHRRNGMPAATWPVYAWYAAGALRSTAADMLSFGEANLGHTTIAGHPVSSELIAAMKLAQTPVYIMPNGSSRQGMAWVSNFGDGEPGANPEILKNGGTVGFSTVILTNPAKDLAIFIAVNKQGANPALSPSSLVGRSLQSEKDCGQSFDTLPNRRRMASGYRAYALAAVGT